MITTGLIEVILYVKDMAAQVSFYREVFALPVVYPTEVTDFSNEYWVVLDAGVCKLALHGGGEGQIGADAAKIVFGVADIQAAYSELVQRAVNVRPIRSAAPGVWVVDGFDPEGNPFSVESREEQFQLSVG